MADDLAGPLAEMNEAFSAKPQLDVKPQLAGPLAEMNAAYGRPQWSDDQYSRESRVRDIMQTHIAAGKTFEEAAPAFKEHLGLDPDKVRPDYRLMEERFKATELPSDPLTGELAPSTLRNVGRVIPGVRTVQGWANTREYGQAKDRIENGTAKEEDYGIVARYEEKQRRDANADFQTKLIHTAAGLPAFAAEAIAGGAAAKGVLGLGGEALGGVLGRAGGMGGAEAGAALVNNPATRVVAGTALTPALWAEQGAQNLNEAKDKESFLSTARAYGAAFTAGTIQNVIIGQMLKDPTASTLLRTVGRATAKTGLGVLEQNVADVATGTAGLTTGYGAFGDLYEGKYGKAGQELAIQAMTYGVFASLHAKVGKVDEIPQKIAESLSEQAKKGVPLPEAVEKVKEDDLAKFAESLGLSGERTRAAADKEAKDQSDEARYQELMQRARSGSGVYPSEPIEPEARPEAPREVETFPPRERPDIDRDVKTVGEKAYQDLRALGMDKDRADTESKQVTLDHLTGMHNKAMETVTAAESNVRALGEQLGIERGKSGLPKKNAEPSILNPNPDTVAAYKKAWGHLSEARSQQKEIFDRLDKARNDHIASIKDDTGITQEAADLKHQATIGEHSDEDMDKAVQDVHDHAQTIREIVNDILKSGKSRGWSEASLRREIERVIQSSSKVAEAIAPGATDAAEQIQKGAGLPEVGGPAAPEQNRIGTDAGNRPESGGELSPEAAQRTRGLTPGQLQEEAAQAALDDQMLGGPGRSTAMNNNIPPASFLAKLGPAAKEVWDGLKERVKGFRANADELAGVIAPRTARKSKPLADAIAARAAVPAAVERGTPYFLDKVATLKIGDNFPGLKGHKIADENQLTQANEVLGATFHEERLRHARMANGAESAKYAAQAQTFPKGSKERQAAEDMRDYWHDEAEKVKSAIGSYELPNEKMYQDLLKSPEYAKFSKDWEQHMTPFMNEKFRSIQGLEEDDPIDRISQLPGRPFNAIAVREGDEMPANGKEIYASTKRGELRNPKINPYGFAKGFTGSAKGYVFDVRKIIENTVYKSTEAATKAEMYRVAEAEGRGKWIAPGEKADFDGKPGVVFRDVMPPKGTQEAEKGQIHFAVDPESANEFRKALDTEKPWLHVPGSGWFTKGSLFSLVEAASHIKNLSTFAMKMPLRSIPDVFRVGMDVLKGNEDLQSRLRELAEMGAVKPKGLETGTLGLPGDWKKIDPSYWTGRALDFVDTTMRLVADKAFDRIKVSGVNVDTSEFARRNFINQLGQYLRRGQNDAVVFLRDTGLGPFATAGTNFTMQALKQQLFSHGLHANDVVTDVKLRAFQMLRLGVVAGGVAALNQMQWGRPDGDDKTPFGAIKVNDKNGKTGYVDVLGLTGWTRGARTTGLLALIEDARAGAPSGNVSTRARSDILHGLAHPAEGPVVNAVAGIGLGENTIGMPVAKEYKPGEEKNLLNAWGATGNNQVLRDIWGTLLNVNPVLSAMSGADRPNDKKTPGEALGVSESTWRLLGPYGVKFRTSAPGQAYDKKTVARPVGAK